MNRHIKRAEKYIHYSLMIMMTGLWVSCIVSLFDKEVQWDKKIILGVIIPAVILLQIAMYDLGKSIKNE